MLLKYFDMYTKKGMRIIPVYKNSKVPVGSEWNVNYDQIKSRDLIATGRYNLGLLLGEWIDVEGDTPEANERLNQLIGDIPHPMYRSQKSIHHLFKNSSHFKTRQFFDIEFRSYGVQSVLPPSQHLHGGIYQWLRGTVFPAPDMPLALQNFYREHYKKDKPKKTKPKIKPGFVKSECKICKQFEFIHKKRLGLEAKAFTELRLPWMCHECREIDVRSACRRIRKTIKQQQLIDSKYIEQQ